MNNQEVKQSIQKLVEKYQRVVEARKIKSYNEAQTRNEFIEPLFESLGWDMRNIITDNEVTTEENVSGGRVDLAFRINGIPKFYLEAKSLKVDLDLEQYARQSVNYAWNKSVPWAVLTDFETVKVFNAETESKSLLDKLVFEIPCSEFINDFDRLWLLSKDSFEQNALDVYAEKYSKKQKRLTVDKKLFSDLAVARQILSKSFSIWNKNISNEELDEGVQRILDRLIFIRVLEDRRLESPILKPLIRVHEKDGQKQIFQMLVTKFRELDDLYNSNLFSPHACEKWEEYDEAIKKVILLFYGTDSYTYDFKEIPSDILGGVYESYLGYLSQKKGGKSSEDSKKRKKQGIFYTPKYIVDYIIKNTLGEKLKEIKGISDLKKIKILDPACGSGSFLTAAMEAINDKYKDFGNEGNLYTKSSILLENIYGVDLDAQAVEIAKLNLLIDALDIRAKLPNLTENIRAGNSLVSGNAEKLEKYFGPNYREQKPFNFEEEFKEVFKQDGFDVIIGNPPYIFARGGNFDEKTKQYYYENFPLASYQLNTYLLFIDRVFSLLKKDGYFGFIIPNTWLTIDTFSVLRKFLLEEASNLQIINIFDKVFGEASVDTCLLIFKKGKPNNIKLGEFKDGQLTIVGDFPTSQFEKNNYIINITLAKSKDKSIILDKVRKKAKPLSDFAIVSTGLKAYQTGKGTPTQTEQIKNSRTFHSNDKKDNTYKKYLEGRDVCRYYLGWSGEFLSYGNWLAEPRESVPFNGARILIRQIPSPPPYSINAVFTDKEFINDINSMIVFDFKCETLYLLAVINSKITTFWFVNTFDKFQRKTFPQFKVKELAIFPIPNASQVEQEKIAKKAQTILDFNKELQATSANTDKYDSLKREIEKLDCEIDEEVYKLYELTDEEIKVIENN